MNFYSTYIVSNILLLLLILWVWIYKLITQCSIWQVRSLWNVENFFDCRFLNFTSSRWPQLSKNAEQRAFAATIRASYHQMHTWLDLKIHFWNKNIPIRRQNRYVFETDIIWFDNFCGTFDRSNSNLVLNYVFFALINHHAFVASAAEIFKNFIHFMNQGSISSKRLDFFVRNYESANCFG